MRFDKKIASLIWWVMNSAVALARDRIFISSNCMNSRVCASSAANGSSSSKSSGSTTKARAMLTRWRMPPDSSCGKCCSKPFSPTRSTSRCAR